MEKHTAAELAKWQGYLSPAEVEMVKEMTRLLPEEALVVAIGAGAGTHTLAMLEVTNNITIFSIDIAAGEQPEYTNEHLRLAEWGYDKTGNVIRIWGDSKVVGKRWPIGVDMLFIDGDHSSDGVRGDILEWVRHVGSRGLLLFHDYGSPRWPAVKDAVDELIAGTNDVVMHVKNLIAFRRL